MKKIKLFVLPLLLLNFFYLSSFGQNDLLINQISGGVVSYITQTNSDTHVFTLFGDGHFSIQNSPTHKFEPNVNGYITETYFVKGYDPVLPPKKTVSTGSIVGGGNFVNPTPVMSEGIDLFTSWATAEGYETYFIIAIKNTSSLTPTNGYIEFSYNPSELNVNFPEIREYNAWLLNRTVIPPTMNNINETIIWDYQNLAYNEIRYVYIPATVVMEVGEKLNLFISNTIFQTSGVHVPNISKMVSFLVRRFPHDPNFKIVNRSCLKKNDGAQRLKYTVGFFNDGNAFANNVYLTDYISPLLDISNTSILDAEYTSTLLINNSSLEIDFIGINLPGTNQIDPNTNTIYSYEDAFTHLTFDVCTDDLLSSGTTIFNVIDIVFDQQPIFTTDPAVISVVPDCSDYELCSGGAGNLITPPVNDGIVVAKNESVFEVSPNPASDKISVYLKLNNDEEKILNISIMNLSGQVVKKSLPNREYIEEFRKDFYINDLENGIYIIVLQTEQNTYAKKILIE